MMLQETKKTGIHYAWKIMISCCALYITVGLLNNTQGLYYPAICADLGCKTSAFTFITVISGLAAMIALGIVDRVYNKYQTRWVLFLMITIYAGTFYLRTLVRSFLAFYIIYIVMGIASAFLIYVPIPMLINIWFKERRGFALGVSLLMSGISAAISSPIISRSIESIGWQKTSALNALIGFAVSAPIVLIFVRNKPQDIGLLPYGANEADAEEYEAAMSETKKAAGSKISLGSLGEEKRIKLIICFIMAVILMLIAGIYHQFATFAESIGVSSAVGAALLSLDMIGNMGSKAIQGVCIDRFGSRKTLTVSFVLVMISMIFLCMYNVPALLYAGALLTGISAANNGIAIPVMLESFSDGEEYVYCISRVTMGTMLATAFATYIGNAIYDICGTYTVEFVLYAVLQLVCLVLMWIILKKK